MLSAIRLFGVCLLAVSLIGIGGVALRPREDGRDQNPQTVGLVCENSPIVIDSAVQQSPSVTAEFSIVNRSDKNLVIERVLKSCSCLSAKSIDGRVVGANESLRYSVIVNLPETGSKREELLVFYADADGGEYVYPPISLVIEMSARERQTMPRVIGVENSHLSFVPLKSLDASERMMVTTIEPEGPKPWLAQIECGAEELDIDLRQVSKEPAEEGLARATYEVVVRWNRLPEFPELTCGIFARTASGEPVNVYLGSLIAKTMESVPFRPTSIVLTPDADHDVVVFDGAGTAETNGSDAGWRLASQSSEASGLDLHWGEFNGRPALHVQLDKRATPAGDREMLLHILSPTGVEFPLPVTVRR